MPVYVWPDRASVAPGAVNLLDDGKVMYKVAVEEPHSSATFLVESDPGRLLPEILATRRPPARETLKLDRTMKMLDGKMKVVQTHGD